MSAWELALLFDYYGSMLTDKQRECFEMRYEQDLWERSRRPWASAARR